MKEFFEKLRRALFSRQMAYRRVLGGQSPEQRLVLKDLARVCRAHESTMVQGKVMLDERAHAFMEGRRWVWLRIQDHLKLTPEQLWDLYDGRGSDQQ